MTPEEREAARKVDKRHWRIAQEEGMILAREGAQIEESIHNDMAAGRRFP